MSMLETTIKSPLTQWDDGTLRITGSRVPIDTVIYHFKLGATAEEIGYKFPSPVGGHLRSDILLPY